MELAREGVKVFVAGRTQPKIDEALKIVRRAGDAEGVVADAGTAEGCAALIKQVPQTDILVNNLGIYKAKPFADIADEDWLKLFNVNVMSRVRLPTHDTAEGSPLGRRSICKTFHGEPAATSVGEMLAAGTAVNGSAGYVMIERVTGTLGGKSGGFVLMHTGIMNRGTPSLTVTVVPDSGTGDLTGLSGKMTTEITGGKHLYLFEYDLPTR